MNRPLAERHPLRRATVTVEGRAFALWHLPDVDDLLDALVAKGPDHPDVRDEKLPYWAEIWPSSRALAGALLRDPRGCAGARAVELGCGPGLAGIAALSLGAEVLFTDWMPEALELSALNARENLGVEAQTRLVDWRAPPPDLRADLVLAADCTYEARFFADLYRCFDSLLAPGGRVLLAEPGRAVAREFFDGLPARGFHARRLEPRAGEPDVWDIRRAG